MPYCTALVTRPEPEATTLSQTLTSLGVQTITAPMLTVHYNQIVQNELALITPSLFQAIIFTSSNAVRSVAPLPSLFSLPCVCVGRNTAETARDTGFSDIHSTDSNVDELITYITTHIKPSDGALLYISGIHTAGNLATSLQDYAVKHFCTYETRPVTLLSSTLETALTQHTIDIALFYSARTSEAFKTLLTAHNMQSPTASIKALCLSKNIAEPLKNLKWKQLYIADKPNNASMLELIEELGFINNSSAV